MMVIRHFKKDAQGGGQSTQREEGSFVWLSKYIYKYSQKIMNRKSNIPVSNGDNGVDINDDVEKNISNVSWKDSIISDKYN